MNKIIRATKRVISDPAFIKNYYKRYMSFIKLVLAFFLLIPCRKRLYSQNIWLISEKGTEARDNGYHLYKYIKEEHPEINAYFVITKKAADLKKIREYGEIIPFNSMKHYIYCLVAKVSACSQPYGALPQPADKIYNLSRKLSRKDQLVIHLKHGITKDELPHALDYDKTHFDLLCCVSERERQFMQEMYGYPDENIKALGFCRFDNLLKQQNKKKQILIMPTHRIWYSIADSDNEATEKEKKTFEKTDFYQAYSSILCDKALIEFIREHEYNIVFYLHYAFQPYVKCFQKYGNDVVQIANREQYDVQELLLESSLLITDYSSVFFDFAYMGKPEIFYQFDEQKYRTSHYKKGYFDYRIDGFGPVYTKEDDVIAEVKKNIINGCIMDDIYMSRVNAFFTTRDTNNCKRIFDDIYRKATRK